MTAGNDAVVDVIADLEAHGMGGVRSEFSEVFAGVVLADGGAALEVLVNVTADPEKLSEFFARVDTVSDAARIEVRLREVSFDPAATAELAQRIAANAPDVRGQLGIRSVSAVQHDTVSGAITVFAADPAVETRTVEIDGIPVTVSGETVELTAQHRTVG